jgi:hypothetical protein
VFRPGKFIVLKERDHVHMDTVEKPYLVDGYIDGMVTGFEQEIGLFRGFDPYREEDRPAAGRADTEIAVPLVDIFYHFRNNRNLSQAGVVMRMGKHDACIIGRTN